MRVRARYTLKTFAGLTRTVLSPPSRSGITRSSQSRISTGLANPGDAFELSFVHYLGTSFCVQTNRQRGNLLPILGKCLGTGYLIYIALTAVAVVQLLSKVVTAVFKEASSSPVLTLIPFVIMFIIFLIMAWGFVTLGFRLWTDRRTRLTWILVCLSLLCFPYGTILGLLSLTWLIVSRQSAPSPAGNAEMS
jgi:hypothetical protein